MSYDVLIMSFFWTLAVIAFGRMCFSIRDYWLESGKRRREIAELERRRTELSMEVDPIGYLAAQAQARIQPKGEPMKHYRQGDVMLVKVKDLPKAKMADPGYMPSLYSNKISMEGDVVLAYGESTGHAHVLDHEKVEAWVTTASKEPPTKAVWDAAADRFIRVMETTSLKHLNLLDGGKPTGEHADIPLDPGVYKVVRQREWTDEQERWVND